jgi:hypothetical protein
VKKFVGWIRKGREFTFQSSPAPIVVDGIRGLLRGYLANRKELTPDFANAAENPARLKFFSMASATIPTGSIF